MLIPWSFHLLCARQDLALGNEWYGQREVLIRTINIIISCSYHMCLCICKHVRPNIFSHIFPSEIKDLRVIDSGEMFRARNSIEESVFVCLETWLERGTRRKRVSTAPQFTMRSVFLSYNIGKPIANNQFIVITLNRTPPYTLRCIITTMWSVVVVDYAC